jgi:hypothetical protein
MQRVGKTLTQETSVSFDQKETPGKKTELAQPAVVADKYGPEAIREQIKDQARLIRAWAAEQGFEEGKDFKVIESIRNVLGDAASVAPQELKEFYVLIHEDNYLQFKDYFTGRYNDEMKKIDPKNNVGLYYSWGGRFLVGWAGVSVETAPASSIEKMTASTHHAEFKKFFLEKYGFEFPTADILNIQLKEMSEKGLDKYQEALAKLRELKDSETLPDDGYGLVDGMVHAIDLLEQSKIGNAVQELPEELQGAMPREMRTYGDLTYNASSIVDLDRVSEITGINIPDEVRIDRIFEHLGFDRNRMQEVCKSFSDYLVAKKIAS